MNKHLIYLTFAAIAVLAGVVSAGDYSGGTGEPNNPYRIATAEDLNDIGNHPAFTGVFDGDGHVTKNLTINDLNKSYLGLFGLIGTSGEIKNLTLENFNLTGFAYVGAVTGKNKGTIINCFSEVNIQINYRNAGGMVGENDGNISLSSSLSNVYGYAALGGLVGKNNGTVDKCNSSGVVETNIDFGPYCGGLIGLNYSKGIILNSTSNSTVYGGYSDAGGFAGTNFGVIKNCHSNGVVDGLEYSTGGLVGYNSGGEIYNCSSKGEVSGKYDIGGLIGWNTGDISNNYSTGDVNGVRYIGGLVGYTSRGSITNCYSTGDVNGIQYIGGLSGSIESPGSINNCYAIGKVLGIDNVGGLVGYHYSGVYTKSFWDSDVNPDVNGIGNTDDPNVIGKTTAEMKTESTFTDAGWDFVEIWNIGENQTYPYLRVYPAGDLNHDKKVNLLDFAVLCDNWLEGVN